MYTTIMQYMMTKANLFEKIYFFKSIFSVNYSIKCKMKLLGTQVDINSYLGPCTKWTPTLAFCQVKNIYLRDLENT